MKPRVSPMIWTVHGETPSLKNTLRRSKSGAFYHADNGVKEYKNLFALQTPSKFKKGITEPVQVFLNIWRSSERKDAHNCEAVIFDALEYAGVIKNDRQIEWWQGSAIGIDKDKPRVQIILEIIKKGKVSK